MARLNITIPDELYTRLEQHRDQLNLSRISAASLQAEVDRLSDQPGPPDPAVTTLLLRLQGTFERWYGRGFANGRSWAAGQASPRELRVVATAMVDWTGEQLLAALEERRAYHVTPVRDPTARPPLFPASFDPASALRHWLAEDGAMIDSSGQPALQELLTYLEGWRDGVAELWTAAEPMLRRSGGGMDRRQAAAGVLRSAAQRSVAAVTATDRSLPALPPGWYASGNKRENYEMRLDRQVAHAGQASALLRSNVDDPEHFGTLAQHFQADAYRGQRLRLSAYVKADDVRGWAGLWLRLDGPDNATQKMLSLDNMYDRPIRGTSDWQQYAIVLDVPEVCRQIAFGILLHGSGAVWVDDFRFEVVGRDVPVTLPKPETRLEPANLDFEE